jgi:hypothetical protein
MTFTTMALVMLNVIYAEHLKFAFYAQCHYAECRYAQCRGAKFTALSLVKISEAAIMALLALIPWEVRHCIRMFLLIVVALPRSQAK